MTYSHNNIRNNIKMTTAPAAKTIRSKNGGGSSKSPSPNATATTTATTPVTAHSNSIASSTNYYSHHLSHQVLSTSPPGCSMSSDASTCSSTSSLGSTGNGGSYFGNRHQRQQQQQQQHQRKQQRQSPQQLNCVSSNGGGGGGGFFYQNNSNNKRGSGSAQKNRDSPRSPNATVRQSPATILGGGYINSSFNGGAGSGSSSGSGRKQRRSPLTFTAGGKISPTHPLIPTALTHFAGSKCFDAPAPTALPKPPQHWTLSKSEEKVASSAGPELHNVVRGGCFMATHAGGHVVKSSKRNLLDEFDTHNLKLLLNVQS